MAHRRDLRTEQETRGGVAGTNAETSVVELRTSSPMTLLSMQRMAGNRATTSFVQRQGGAGAPPAPAAASPVYVSFTHDPPPRVDHSTSNPGPAGTGADRAGHTGARVGKRMTISWDTGAPGPDGRVPLFARSVNVFYTLGLTMAVSSDYAAGTCPYRVTLAHERFHVSAFIRIFRNSRNDLVRRLRAVPVPTETSPELVAPGHVEARQEQIGQALRQVILDHSQRLVGTMTADRQAKDSAAAYRAVYSQCPMSEW